MQQSHSRQAFSVAEEEVEGYTSQETEPENIPLVTLDFPQHCYQQISTDIFFHRISSSLFPLPILFVPQLFYLNIWSPTLHCFFLLVRSKKFSYFICSITLNIFYKLSPKYRRCDFPKPSPPCTWHIVFLMFSHLTALFNNYKTFVVLLYSFPVDLINTEKSEDFLLVYIPVSI